MIKITKEKTKYHEYAFESDYDVDVVAYCKFLKDTFGWRDFQWDANKSVWRFKDLDILEMIRNKFNEIEIDSDVIDEFLAYNKNLLDEEKRDIKAKQIKEAKTSNLTVIGIKGDLYEYQKIGIEFLLNSGGRALLADSPGVGKTVQAIGYASHLGFKRNIVVCPASVKFSWEDEIAKWTNLKSFVVGPKTDLKEIPFDVQFIIINFDILKKFHNEFKKYKWDCMIVDECHLIKSQSAIRSKVVKSLTLDIPNVIMLTGTPVLSRPIEMFNMLNIIDSSTWGNYYSFATKYCEGKQGYYGFEAKGASNLEELNTKISKYFLRRTKDDVLKHLPTKNRIKIPIDLPVDIRSEYELAEESLLKYIQKYKKDKTEDEIAKALSAEKLVKLNLLREINTRGKIKAAEELIESILDAGEKVLVFSSFNNPLKELAKKYSKESVLLLGETDIETRGKIVKDFQSDPNIKIFFGGTQSAGVGITLTAASNVIFLDYPWNPADLEQSENRAHRPGATYQSLNIYQIVSRDSVDSFMEKLLSKKQNIIDQLIEEKDVESDSVMISSYLKSLKQKYDR